MSNNNQTNNLIKWSIIVGDFVVFNIALFIALHTIQATIKWSGEEIKLFLMICNVALSFGEYFFPTTIHQRLVGADSILKHVTLLILSQTAVSYILLRALQFDPRIGLPLLALAPVLLIIYAFLRLIERVLLKKLRKAGFNTRHATFVGSNEAIYGLYNKLLSNPTLGYQLKGYYGSLDCLPQQGSQEDFFNLLDTPEQLMLGDELYLCISQNERNLIERTSQMCDQQLVKFYYVPIPEETLNLEHIMLEDYELLTNYTSPLEDPLNKATKRLFDILLSSLALIITGVLFPFIVIFIKLQSPGPIFFKQIRTGLDGRDFYCYKFRSMHVNKDSDRVQATKDDPRKYRFGNFMRKTNIDELPQFWNVLRGDMSIVGPRPHMLAHTEQYSHLIAKYMIRHFVKPGVTGWAQVTGYRGVTQELWQMEGRVERDIWYIQHWSFWLDMRIIWMTIKTIFIHDKNAY